MAPIAARVKQTANAVISLRMENLRIDKTTRFVKALRRQILKSRFGAKLYANLNRAAS